MSRLTFITTEGISLIGPSVTMTIKTIHSNITQTTRDERIPQTTDENIYGRQMVFFPKINHPEIGSILYAIISAML